LVNWLTSIPGVTKNSEGFEISLYPNPTTAKAVLSIEGKDISLTDVTVLNAVGEVVYRAEAKNEKSHEINLGQYAAGRYLVRATTSTGVVVTKPLNVIK